MRFVIIYKVSIIKKFSFDYFEFQKVFPSKVLSCVFITCISGQYYSPSTTPQICIFSVLVFLIIFIYFLFAKRKYYTFFKLFYDDFMNNKDSNLLSIIYGCKRVFFLYED